MREKAQNIVSEIVLITALVLATLALGYVGFTDYVAGKNYSSADILYKSLQLFILEFNFDTSRPINWMLELSRFLAPLLSSYAAARALMALFAEPLLAFRVANLKGHVVVCGLSRKGFDLCRDLRSRDQSVVLIEWNKENDWIETCRALGVRVVLGDATEKLVLHKAAAQHARLLFAVCDEDGINAEIGLQAQSLARRHSGKAPMGIFVHVENLKLTDLLRRSGLNEKKKAGARIRVFNIQENAARHVLKKFPLDGAGIGPDDPRRPHLVIIGFGRMGETMMLHAAHNGQYANDKKLRITAIDLQMKRRSGPFLARYPNIKEVCDVEFLQEDFEGPEASTALDDFARDDSCMLTVAICLAEDGQCLAAALRAAEIFRELKVPILVRLDRDAGLADLARGERDHSNSLIQPFISGGKFLSEKEIVDRDRNKLAKAIHEDRRSRNAGEYPTPWTDLDEESRDFCRQAADHVDVKLRAIGCKTVSKDRENPTEPPGAEFQFTPSEVALLARLEHRRWRAALILSGYKLGETADGQKDSVHKIHPKLIEWDALHETFKAKARSLAERIPVWLSMIGKKIQR